MALWFPTLLLLCSADCFVFVAGSGHLALRLTEYTNPNKGKLLNGSCCDGFAGHDCSSVACDPYFIIKITERNQQTQNVNLQYETGFFPNSQHVTFTDHIGSTLNPMNGSIKVWPGSVEIHVDVMDNNTDQGVTDGLIARLYARYSYTMPQQAYTSTTFLAFDLQPDPSILQAEVNVRCDEGYTWDIYCYKLCRPVNNATSHLGCDSNGDHICFPGWSGSPKTGCLIGTCSPSPCQHGGNCSLDQGTSKCYCAPGYTGHHCETDLSLSVTTSAKPTIVQSGPYTTKRNHVPVAAIAGSVGGLFLLLLLGLLFYFLIRKKQQEKRTPRSNIVTNKEQRWANRVVNVKPSSSPSVTNSYYRTYNNRSMF